MCPKARRDAINFGRRATKFISIVVEWDKLDYISTAISTVFDVDSNNLWVDSCAPEPKLKCGRDLTDEFSNVFNDGVGFEISGTLDLSTATP
ncbi:hypothetical protein N7539_006482 [Penicillium diatomitis]|uniref:Uncharacterized protein n=1 Tax=Penicillium diatomitis TaxID=2819901 RepID=A0A9W9X3F8_9EURO|nr:uncharacterized protein N7539_006482 [Penicillium diatomitis]KAJ5483036.1 hypothetical protein N7539_006482 [Penicillium diatomitis]